MAEKGKMLCMLGLQQFFKGNEHICKMLRNNINECRKIAGEW